MWYWSVLQEVSWGSFTVEFVVSFISCFIGSCTSFFAVVFMNSFKGFIDSFTGGSTCGSTGSFAGRFAYSCTGRFVSVLMRSFMGSCYMGTFTGGFTCELVGVFTGSFPVISHAVLKVFDAAASWAFHRQLYRQFCRWFPWQIGNMGCFAGVLEGSFMGNFTSRLRRGFTVNFINFSTNFKAKTVL